MKKRTGYAAASYSSDVKEVLGAVGHQLRQRGWPLADVKVFVADA
jgi:hypothetical protein